MDLSVWLAYLVATIILSVSPGPGVFSSLAAGISHGFPRGLWNAVGMQVANFILLGLVSVGLGALLLASETLFTTVKWAGVAYLVWLGIVFYVAVLPQFIDTARPPFTQYAILGITTLVVDLIVMAGYIAVAARVLAVMRDPDHLRWVNRLLGGAFVGAGAALAAFRRAPLGV